MSATLSLDPTVCPLCGQFNQCAGQVERLTGIKQPPCWCNTASFAAELLARIPEPARRKACVCATCASQSLSI